MLEITDSHIHIWDLDSLTLPWLESCPGIAKNYTLEDWEKAYAVDPEVSLAGAVYVEVDCDNPVREDEVILQMQDDRFKAHCMKATLSGTMRLPAGIQGVREPLHVPSSPKGRCLEPSFIAGLRTLAAQDLIFESCHRVEELDDLYEALKQVPEVKVVINHLGNVQDLTEEYKAAMTNLASLPNVYVKVSGFPTGDKAKVVEILDFITSVFKPSKLLYASNYPVIELYGTMEEHLAILREYFHDDPDFFSKNAKKLYKINTPQVIANVIHLRPEKAEYYKQLHADPFPAVNEMIRECGITKYQIYCRDNLLFSLMEYNGDDFQYDMSKMADDPETNRWWKETDPCQYRIQDARKDEWWADMDLVYDLDGLKK